MPIRARHLRRQGWCRLVNERLPVKSFYDGLEHWYILLKELAGPHAAH